MCVRVTCEHCGKPGYAGCGAHIEQVLGNVPAAERCRCREEAAAKPMKARASRSLRERLFGK
jgi:hypothetical protein